MKKDGEILFSVTQGIPDVAVETCGSSWQISQPPRVNHGGVDGHY